MGIGLSSEAKNACHITIDDLILNQTEPDASWQPSAISRINGTDAIDYFTRFAALNSWGTTEPHADWNLLVDNPLIDVLDAKYSLWGGSTTFYPGDTFTYVFENGSTFEEQWLAAYYDPGDTGPLETGGDFYNFFVLGFYPASYNVTTDETEANVTEDAGEPLTSFSDINSAFPRADVWQQNLTVDGYLTGYFLRDESLAVLSIPSFWADGEAIQAFADTVQDFLSQSKAAGMERVLIDLQQNAGGDIALAYSTFKQFFPATEPFAGSVMRANPLADILGSTITEFWDTLDITDPRYQEASADEWIATTKINAATGQNFTSWTEMYGPHFDGVSNFTLTERLNTSNFLFDYSMMGQQNPPSVLLTPYAGEPPYAADDIIMVSHSGEYAHLSLLSDIICTLSQLSDGLCSSACSLFMEMMHKDAGVKNVVIGGRPSYGPMQTPSGSRGARYYDFVGINADYQNAVGVAEILREDSIVDIDVSILNPLNYSDFFVYDAGISLRAQVREGDTVPLSMRYEAADCRIFWTPDTFQNFTNLWRYANAAMTTSPSLCAEGSTGYTGPSAQPAPAAQRLAAVNYSSIGVPNLDLNPTGIADIPFLVSDGPLPDVPPVYIPRPMKLAYPDYVPRPQYLNKAQEEAYDKQQQQRYNDRLQQNNIKKHLSCGFSAPPCKRSIRKRRKLS